MALAGSCAQEPSNRFASYLYTMEALPLSSRLSSLLIRMFVAHFRLPRTVLCQSTGHRKRRVSHTPMDHQRIIAQCMQRRRHSGRCLFAVFKGGLSCFPARVRPSVYRSLPALHCTPMVSCPWTAFISTTTSLPSSRDVVGPIVPLRLSCKSQHHPHRLKSEVSPWIDIAAVCWNQTLLLSAS